MTEERAGFGSDPKPYYLAVGVLVVLEFVRRAFLGYVPNDFTAYLAAADVFAQGSHPYQGPGLVAERYDGMPYNYLPGTLYLIYPLSFLPTAVAVALDWVARCAAVFFALRTFWKHLLPEVPFALVLLLGAFHQPLLVDLLFGNVTAYMLAALAVCVAVAHGETPRPGGLVAVFLAGVALAFKPFWVLSGLFILAARKRWLAFVVCGAGAAVVPLLSLAFVDIFPQYLEHVRMMAEFYHSVALMTFAPWAVPVVFVAWLVAGVMLVRRNPEDAWLWAFCAIPFWPRLGTYSYVLVLPLLFFYIERWGWLRGLAVAAVFVGPIPWLLRVAPVEPQFVIEASVHWLWAWLFAVVTFVVLWREGGEA